MGAQKFASYLLRHAQFPKLLLALLYYMSEYRRDDGMSGCATIVRKCMWADHGLTHAHAWDGVGRRHACERLTAKYSVVHLVGFTLLLLSADRTLGVRLNLPYKVVLPALKLPLFEGNYADVLILVRRVQRVAWRCRRRELGPADPQRMCVLAPVTTGGGGGRAGTPSDHR